MPTLYHYVSDKSELLYYIRKWLHEKINAQLDSWEPRGESVADDLGDLVELYFRALYANAKYARFVVIESRNFKPEHRPDGEADTLHRMQPFRELIVRGMAEGVFREVDPATAASAIYTLAWAWVMHTGAVASAGSFEQFLAFNREFVVAGLLQQRA